MRRTVLPLLAACLLIVGVLLTGQATATKTEGTSSPATDAAGDGDGGQIRLQRAHMADYAPTFKGKRPIFILVLGSDTRSKQDKAVEHSKCDSIHIIGINPDKQAASILGFPRDSWIKLPGGGEGKINEMCYGGPQGAVATMENLTGIRIDYYALAGFYDFKDIVTGVGNVMVDVPYDIDDSHSKARFSKGKEDMTGREALQFVRARYDVPGGDFGRSENQGYFLIQMLQQYEKESKKDPSILMRYLGVIMAQLKTDLSTEELIQMAFTVSQVDAAKVTNRVTPGSIGHEGAESTVNLSSSANGLYADMANDGLLKG